jgi:NAD+ kinase
VSVRAVAVLTHARPAQTATALRGLLDAARAAGVEVHLPPAEAEKHGLADAPGVVATDDHAGVDLCVALGGDGTILQALRRYAGTEVPVFAVNFGHVGFLATLEPEELDGGFDRALRGDFERLELPAIVVQAGGRRIAAVNDVSLHRRLGNPVAQLVLALEGDEVGHVRCDGVVICTPAGSTGYNLANGGPVVAWGVEGFAVSFIAPHSLGARALVAAPDDTLTVATRAAEPVDLSIDGRPAGELAPGEVLTARFVRHATVLAQAPGSTFYRRLREKFGRLAS